ncbi:hypothetical protein [Rhabdochromatium marinum]|uniref:hypothetical protein n=1 Tax=Rhabdochromatium marinum TaxID=48729 RepID=UPI0019065E8A|nr:hypothetical protein [Rhabdochromatium marinum]MBK1648234.1 hypothetical protein [Rhabdochromatium marinum]
MTTLELASLIMSAEFALASAVILFVVRRRQRRAAADQHSQTADLKSTVQGELPSRRESLTKLFQSNAQLKGRKLTTTVDTFLAREQAFYDAMLNIHLNENGKSLRDIPDELRKVLSPWAELQANTNQEVTALGDLRTENAELGEQLQHNKEVIERLLEEYNATFNRFQKSDDDDDNNKGAEADAEEAAPAVDEPEEEGMLAPPLPEADDDDSQPVQLLDAVPDDSDEEMIITEADEGDELADLFDSRS